MDNPAKQGNPENRRKHELDDCHKEPALKELTETGNEKTAESRKDDAARADTVVVLHKSAGGDGLASTTPTA